MLVILKEIEQITTEKMSEPTVLPSTQVGTLNYYHEKSSYSYRSSFCCSTEIHDIHHSQTRVIFLLDTALNEHQLKAEYTRVAGVYHSTCTM